MAAHKHKYFLLVSRHFWFLPSACITHNEKKCFIEFLDLENMGIAVGIEQLYCIQTEIQVFPVCYLPFWIADIRLRHTIWESAQRNFSTSRYMFIVSGILQLCFIHSELLVFPLLKPPFWISDFRLHHTVWEIAFLNISTLKTWELLLEFCSYVVYRLRYKYFRFVGRHYFWLLLASHTMENIFIEFLNFENMGVAVGILQLCCIHTEILVFPLWEPPSWISDFRLHHTI